MPVIINNMPSGAVQYPIVTGPNQAQINAANMFGFVNQNPNKESDMAAMLALVQLLSQQKNIDLQREFGREDNALRRAELEGMLNERRADRDLQRALADKQYTMMADQLGLTRTELDGRMKALSSQIETMNKTTDASVRATDASTAAQTAQNKMVEQMMPMQLADLERTRTEGTLATALAQQEKQSTLESSLQEKQKIGAYDVGATQAQRLVPANIRTAMSKLAKGERIGPSEAAELTTGIEAYTTRVRDEAKALGSEDERIGMVTTASELVDSLRSQLSPSQIDTWLGRESPKKDLFGRVNYAAQVGLDRLKSATGGVLYPSRAAYANRLETQALTRAQADAARAASLQSQAQAGLNRIYSSVPLNQQAPEIAKMRASLFAPNAMAGYLAQSPSPIAQVLQEPMPTSAPAPDQDMPDIPGWEQFLQSQFVR